VSSRTRFALGVLAAGVAIAVLVAIAPPSAGSGRLVVLHRFLADLGVDVADASEPPSSGTYVLVADRRSREEDDALLAWVERGGRLVVADPDSVLFSTFAVSGERAGVLGTKTIRTDCVRPETLGVQQIEVSSSDQVLSAPSAAGCFAIGDRSYALFIPRGSGMVVLLGGSSPLRDQLLNHADDAVFAKGVLGDGPVTFGPPSIASGSGGLWSLLPSGAKAVVWEAILAAVVFALARGRRLGRPIPEEAVSPIPSGELVHATARLYRRAHARAFCSDAVRAWTANRAVRRLGIPREADPDRTAATIAASAGLDRTLVEHALTGPEPADDAAFVAVCRELDDVFERIGGTRR
jgi:hypothetical protein